MRVSVARDCACLCSRCLTHARSLIASAYNYDTCTVRANVDMVLKVRQWQLGDYYDYNCVFPGDTMYSHCWDASSTTGYCSSGCQNGPHGRMLLAGDKLNVIIYTGGIPNAEGFEICYSPVPSPNAPPFAPLPAAAVTAGDAPVLAINFNFTATLMGQDDLFLFKTAVHTLANCSAYPTCEVTTEGYLLDYPVNPANLLNPANISLISILIISNQVNVYDISPPPPGSPVYSYDSSPDIRRRSLHNSKRRGLRKVEVEQEDSTSKLDNVKTYFTTSDPATISADLTNAGSTTSVNLQSTPTATTASVPQSYMLPPVAPPSPSPPPPVPPPPSAPNPPSPPPGVCTDTCNSGGGGDSGVCNDGGPDDPRPQSPLCTLGSDCSDCGVRTYCSNCGDECVAFNLANPSSACFSHQYDNQECNDSCNRRECGYDNGRCTAAQIESKCKERIETGGYDYSTKPLSLGLTNPPTSSTASFTVVPAAEVALQDASNIRGLVPVAMHLEMAPTRTMVEDQLQEFLLVQEMTYTLQWADPRLFDSPCAGALPNMLSLSFEQGLSDIAREAARTERMRYFVPTLKNGDYNAPGFRPLDEEATFEMNRDDEWLAGYEGLLNRTHAGANGDVCKYCARWTGDIELQQLQPLFQFFYYPFDVQTILLSVKVDGAHLYGCHGTGADSPVLAVLELTEENKNEMLLPPTGEWVMGSLADSVRVAHPTDKRGVPILSKCEVRITAGRNAGTFIFRNLATNVSDLPSFEFAERRSGEEAACLPVFCATAPPLLTYRVSRAQIIAMFGSILTALAMHPGEHVGDRAAVLVSILQDSNLRPLPCLARRGLRC